MNSIPSRTKVLVIGGGPGGATAAGLLARSGIEVAVLEKTRFPRYHIGESLLPSILQIFDILGIREKIEAHGFQRKNGALLHWGAERWPLNFGELAGSHTYSFQVIRSEFDRLLLEHAREQGASVIEQCEVTALEFDGGRPRRAAWKRQAGNGDGASEAGVIAFDHLIDASGRHSLMANRYLQNRRYHRIFQNVAVWGYWQDTHRLPGSRQGDIAVNSIPNGWLWAIPLHDGTMSVGVVMHKDAFQACGDRSLEEILDEAIAQAPLVRDLVGCGRRTSGVYREQDYSYACETFCGPGFFLVGDAACFLDPLLSSGVHLATFSALLAAAGIASIERGEIGEAEVRSYFEKSYRQAYLRFLVFLSAFYDVNRGRDSYFWEAQRLTQQEIKAEDIKRAFLTLVTGLKDLEDSRSDARHFILQEMTRRIEENLEFRRDKEALAALQGEQRRAAEANARFFASVEGLFALREEEAVDGLYVATEPFLRLARVGAPRPAAPEACLSPRP